MKSRATTTLTRLLAISALALLLGAAPASALTFDADVTPDVIFGTGGNANGGFTVDLAGGVELGLRAKEEFTNTFNSNGAGIYTHEAGAGSGGVDTARWFFEWSINSDQADATFATPDVLTFYDYRIDMDFDASAATDFFSFDPINEVILQGLCADHSFGFNNTASNGGVEACSGPGPHTPAEIADYQDLASTRNVAQNSWQLNFFELVSAKDFDPNEVGTYEFVLTAFEDGTTTQVAQTAITVTAVPEPMTALLLTAGLSILGVQGRRRQPDSARIHATAR